MDRTRSGKLGLGVWALIVALVALVVLTFLPSPYVIQRPGPVYDTLGTATDKDGDEVPLIKVEGAETFETAGTLDLTTVQVVGNRERTPSWFELALAWMDSSRAVVPLDSVFPEGVTTEQRDERNATLMVDSQHEATAAALNELGYDTGAEVVVVEAVADSPADGALKADDVITAIDGTAVESATELRAAIQEAAGDPVTLTVRRDGEDQAVEVTPEEHTEGGVTTWLIGVTLRTDYDFEIDVTIQLDNVGGPSAGMMSRSASSTPSPRASSTEGRTWPAPARSTPPARSGRSVGSDRSCTARVTPEPSTSSPRRPTATRSSDMFPTDCR